MKVPRRGPRAASSFRSARPPHRLDRSLHSYMLMSRPRDHRFRGLARRFSRETHKPPQRRRRGDRASRAARADAPRKLRRAFCARGAHHAQARERSSNSAAAIRKESAAQIENLPRTCLPISGETSPEGEIGTVDDPSLGAHDYAGSHGGRDLFSIERVVRPDRQLGNPQKRQHAPHSGSGTWSACSVIAV